MRITDRLWLWHARRKFRALRDLMETTDGHCALCDDATRLYRYSCAHFCETCWPFAFSGVMQEHGKEEIQP